MLRSFGAGEALRALAVGFKQLEHGSVPAALGLLDFACYKRADLREVIAHLSQCWCKTDTHSECVHFDKRLAKRAQEFHQISVVPNFHLLYERLALRGMPPPNGEAKSASVRGESMVYQEQVDIQIYGFIPDKTREKAQQMRDPQALILNAFEPPASGDAESWVVENISRMGYGVSIVRLKEDWVQSNTVIGIQADNAPWQICVIRRVVTETVENMQAGIQILSTKPHAALLCPAANEMSIWEAAADTQISHRTPSILMDEEAPYQNEESLLLVSKTYQLQRIYTMLVGGAWRTIRLLERINVYRNVDQIIFTDVKQPRNVNH